MTATIERIAKDWAEWDAQRKGMVGQHPMVRRVHAARVHLARGHHNFSQTQYGRAAKSIKRAHDAIADIGNNSGPPGSSPQGGFMSAVSAAQSHLAAAHPLIQKLVTNPALHQHIQTVHNHLHTAAQHLTTAATLAHHVVPLLQEEVGVDRLDVVAQFLAKAAGGEVHTPEGEHKAAPLKRYWTHGAGAAKIAWGTPGDFDRCVAEVSKHMDPERAKGYCNERHHDALGIYPATHAKLDRAGHGDVRKDESEVPAVEDLAAWLGGA